MTQTIGQALSQEFNLEVAIMRQKQMEEDAVSLGVERFRRAVAASQRTGSEAGVGGARKLLVEGMERMVKALEEFINPPEMIQRGDGQMTPNGALLHPHAAMRWVKMVGVDVTAYMVVKVILDAISKRVDFRKAGNDIADLMCDELRYRRFQEQAPGLFDYKVKSFNTSNYAHMARSMDAAMDHMTGADGRDRKIDTSDLEMDQRDRTLVGTKLLDFALAVTGFFTVEHSRESEGEGQVKDIRTIVATPETLEWLQKRNAALEVLWPVNLPMVAPPLPWKPREDGSGVDRGGYRFSLMGKYPMRRGLSKKAAAVAEKALMPKVYSALNRIQETPWRINRRVLEVIEQVIVAGGMMAGVPKWADFDAPEKPKNAPVAKPACSDMCAWEDARNQCACSPERAEYDKVWKPWRKKAHEIHEKNHERRMAKVSFENLMSVVRKMKDEIAMWFPHNMDFRGRVYPLTSYLSPQGDDMSKGLLLFAQGIAVGEGGGSWLAVHGANCLGKTLDGRKLSKMTLDERAQYIVSITPEIQAVAKDPLGNKWWSNPDNVDDPIQFLAFCFEWADFWSMEEQGRGAEFVSALPVAMDGTCNGLQHYAAMFKDPILAKEVNVSPTVRPADIYQSVADNVEKDLERDAAGNLSAKLWMSSGLVNRKLTKKPTMTFSYGSRQYGFSEQLAAFVHGMKTPETMAKYEKTLAHFSIPEEQHEEMMKAALEKSKSRKKKKAKEGEEPQKFPSKGGMRSLIGTESKPGLACQYMAGLIWNGLQGVVKSAQLGMEWMQESARRVGNSGNVVQWVVPGTGLLVIQEYYEETTRQVETKLAGKVYRPRLSTPTNVPDTRRQASAIAPNVIHSFDAACLMLTVELASEAGIDCFMMIHDSYGVRAGEAAVMAECLRQAFFGFYTQRNVAQELAEQFRAQTSAEQLEEEGYPEVPPMGNLDLSGVLVSDHFFS